MKKTLKKTAALLAFAVLFLATATISAGDNQTPTYIRVGLYFNDTSVKTALPSYNISAASGLDIGFVKDGSFVEMYKRRDSSNIVVKKDDSYYIKIGADLSDVDTAKATVTAYNQQGVRAQIVYNDSLQIWSGPFESDAAAKAGLEDIAKRLGGAEYLIIKPSINRIAVTDAQSSPICVFASNSLYLQIQPTAENNPNIFKIEDKQYRGVLEIRRPEAGSLTAINIVKIQEYLYGNVPSEIGGRSPAEALKAQAVASKMYALNSKGKHGKSGFDVCTTTGCQVYRGYAVEVDTCNKAIDEVYDKTITYNGQPARQIYYFASSGGRTEDVKNVWGSSYPYLVSVEDKYEKITTWTKTLRAADVKTILPELGNILGISVTKRAESGRVTQLSVRGEKRSDPALYSLEKTRTIFGLKSQLYTVTTDADVYTASSGNEEGAISEPQLTQLGGMAVISSTGVSSVKASNNSMTILGANDVKRTAALVPETYTFTGKGWGHAVGMSQEGAIGMGKAGIKYDEILTHYFQGTKVE